MQNKTILFSSVLIILAAGLVFLKQSLAVQPAQVSKNKAEKLNLQNFQQVSSLDKETRQVKKESDPGDLYLELKDFLQSLEDLLAKSKEMAEEEYKEFKKHKLPQIKEKAKELKKELQKHLSKEKAKKFWQDFLDWLKDLDQNKPDTTLKST